MAAQNGEAVGPQKSFVIEMRARREAVGLSRYRLAEALGCTPQWLSKVENHEKPPSEGLADDLDTYWTTGGTFRRLWEQMVEARRQGLIPMRFRPLVDMEKKADQISIFAPVLTPGLLQTAEHARLILESELRPDKVEGLLSVRMGRQEIFTTPQPPAFFILLREAVVRDLPPEIIEDQCKHLLAVMSEPHVSLQLIPRRARVFQGSAFHLLSFSTNADVAYVDGPGVFGQMLTEPAEVHSLAVLFNTIRSAALPVEDTEALIRSIMEGR